MRSYWHPIVVVGGVLQTALYCDFFYYYITAKKQVRRPPSSPSLRPCGADYLTCVQGGLSEPVKVQVDAGVV